MSDLTGNLDDAGLGPISGGAVQDLDEVGHGSSSGIIGNNRWVLGARLYLRTATQYVADDYIKTDGALYEGRVLNFGYIDRSIDAPASAYRVGDCQIRIADTDEKWRILLSVQTGLRRLIELVRIADGAVVGGFEITQFSFGDGYVEVRGVDILSKWLYKPIPGLMDNGGFMPIIFGEQISSDVIPQGRVRCPHFGETTKTTGSVAVDRWVASRDPLQSLVVYRKRPDESIFTVVPGAEYVETYDEPLLVADKTYQPHYIDFLATQDEGTLVHHDTTGPSTIFGFVLDAGRDPLDGNPIDWMTNVFWYSFSPNGAQWQAERYNTDNFSTLRDYFDTNSITADGVIDEAITPATFLSRWQASFEAKLFVNRHYQFDVSISVEENVDRDVLTSEFDFVRITPMAQQQAYNRIVYRNDLNVASGVWYDVNTYDNTADQEELGNVLFQGDDDTVEVEYVDMYYVSDSAQAAATIARRAAYRALGAFRVEFTVPLPEWFETLELGLQIGVTDPRGIGGGWVNQECEILSIRHDLGALETTCEAIMRVPVSYGADGMTGGLVFLFL